MGYDFTELVLRFRDELLKCIILKNRLISIVLILSENRLFYIIMRFTKEHKILE